MKIVVPHWAAEVEDEGAITLFAFFYRVCEMYGYDSWYYLDVSDFSKIANKFSNGHHAYLTNWLMTFEGTDGNLKLGDPFTHKIMFKLKQRPTRGMQVPTQAIKEIRSERQIRIWLYILGCMNHNLINDDTGYGKADKRKTNVSHITEFNLSNEAIEIVEQK